MTVTMATRAYCQGQHTFTRNADGKVTKPRIIIHLWKDGTQMTDEQAKRATVLPNIERKFEVRNDSVFLTYELLSENQLKESQLLQEKKEAEYKNLFVDKASPFFSVTDLDGNNFSTKSLLGKTVILIFWFTH